MNSPAIIDEVSTLAARLNLGVEIELQKKLGIFWGKGGVISLAKSLYVLEVASGHAIRALSPLSEAYFDASWHAATLFVGTSFWKDPLGQVILLFRTLFFMHRAVRISEEFAQKMGRDDLTPEEVNVRSAILAQRLFGAHRAIDVITRTFALKSSESPIPLAIRARLLMRRARLYNRLGNLFKSHDDYCELFALPLQELTLELQVELHEFAIEHCEGMHNFEAKKRHEQSIWTLQGSFRHQ